MDRFLLGWMGAVLLVVAVGCDVKSKSPPPEGITRLESLVSWYRSYRTDHGGKAPVNEQELVKYVGEKMKAVGSTFDPNDLVVSPRDKQKYVINFGKAMAPDPQKTLLAYEQEGYGGKKLVAFESSQTREVDDAELKTLLMSSK